MKISFHFWFLLTLIIASFPAYADYIEPPAGCNEPQLICIEAGGTRYFESIPIYQNCWKYEVKYNCPDWTHYTNTCGKELNCSPDGEVVTIDPWKKQMQMVCKDITTQYQCIDYKEKKYCDAPISYTKGYEKFTSQPTDSFNKAISVLGLLDEIQKSVSVNPLQVFKGDKHICEIPINMGPLTTDCCDKRLNTHGSKWSINQCTKEDIKLASAQRANRTHYIGSWCEKHLPWPLDNVCIDRHKGFCAFNTLLDRIVGEQGRKQLENLALDGGDNTKFQDFNWAFSLPTEQWNRATVNGIDIATYSWQMIHEDNIPIRVTSQDKLTVSKDGSNTIHNITVKFNCRDNLCSVNAVDSNSESFTHFMNPLCANDPASWVLGMTSIQQGICLTTGQQPDGWPKIVWQNNLPSLWQFQILKSFEENIVNHTLNKKLTGDKTLVIDGNCSFSDCTYNVKITDKNDEQKGQLHFPLSCQKSDDHKISLSNTYIAPKCLPAEEIIAVCNNGSTCGELPSHPENHIGKAYNNWSFFEVNPNSENYIFLTSVLAAKGRCDNNQCKWQFASIGQNGFKTNLLSTISWNMYSAEVKEGMAQPGFSDNVILQTGNNVTIKPYLFTLHSDLSKGFQLQYKLPNSNWITHESYIPLTVSESSPIILNSQPLIKFYGNCNQVTGDCNYSIATQVQVKAKPWGSAKHPNCEGFSPEELMLIDLSKMDLSEWINTLNVNFDPEKANQLAKMAKTSMEDFSSSMRNNGEIHAPVTNKSQNIVLKVQPTEGQGPFEVTLTATAYWPYYIPYGSCGYPATGKQNRIVNELNIDWGDGKSNTLKSNQIIVESVQGQYYGNDSPCTYQIPIFKLTHIYAEPLAKNTTQHIVGKFITDSGSHIANVDVLNYWDTPTTDINLGGGAAQVNKNPIHPNQMPGSGTYNPTEIPGYLKT